jgi:hypothetical protein
MYYGHANWVYETVSSCLEWAFIVPVWINLDFYSRISHCFKLVQLLWFAKTSFFTWKVHNYIFPFHLTNLNPFGASFTHIRNWHTISAHYGAAHIMSATAQMRRTLSVKFLVKGNLFNRYQVHILFSDIHWLNHNLRCNTLNCSTNFLLTVTLNGWWMFWSGTYLDYSWSPQISPCIHSLLSHLTNYMVRKAAQLVK